ncbi:MAG: methyltransferase domain-containing protein [Proteobacteria bacterium]|nr:methyltransferase domain-containing protein [Pseudomonadota bacterium]
MKSPSVLNPEHILFDRHMVRLHRDRAAHIDWSRHGFLVNEVASRLMDRLLDISEDFEVALDLGSRGGEFGRHLVESNRVSTLISADLSEEMLATQSGLRVMADEEFLPFAAASFSLVGSVLGLHWTNDLPGALVQIAKILKPNGLFLGALFGTGTLSELRWCLNEAESEIMGGVSPRVSPFTEVRDAGSLLQRAGFSLPVTDVDMITLKYQDPFALMRELRGLGETNALMSRLKSFTGRRVIMRAAELYIDRFSDPEGRVPASFQVIYLAGWSPHESQQKPMARGSGKINLKDILGK